MSRGHSYQIPQQPARNGNTPPHYRDIARPTRGWAGVNGNRRFSLLRLENIPSFLVSFRCSFFFCVFENTLALPHLAANGTFFLSKRNVPKEKDKRGTCGVPLLNPPPKAPSQQTGYRRGVPAQRYANLASRPCRFPQNQRFCGASRPRGADCSPPPSEFSPEQHEDVCVLLALIAPDGCAKGDC